MRWIVLAELVAGGLVPLRDAERARRGRRRAGLSEAVAPVTPGLMRLTQRLYSIVQ